MEQVGVWSLAEPSRPVFERTFEDPEQPGYKLRLRLRSLDGVTGSRSSRMALEFIETYVTGTLGPPPDKQVLKPPLEKFEPVPGSNKKINFDEDFCWTAAKIICMWADEKQDAPGVVEIAGWQRRLPSVWFEILNWLGEIENETIEVNQSGGTSASGSRRSSAPQESTPPSSTTSANSDAASTPTSEPSADRSQGRQKGKTLSPLA